MMPARYLTNRHLQIVSSKEPSALPFDSQPGVDAGSLRSRSSLTLVCCLGTMFRTHLQAFLAWMLTNAPSRTDRFKNFQAQRSMSFLV